MESEIYKIIMIAILHPYILHYRNDFFNGLKKSFPVNIYCYENENEISNSNFQKSELHTTPIKSLKIGPFLWYDPKELLANENKVLVLMLTFLHLTTWYLLLTKSFHKKKIILWGHGISVKRYVREEKHPNILLKLMILLSDYNWFYTKNELNIWKRSINSLNGISLNNTISKVNDILNTPILDKHLIKQKFRITQPRIIIYCARFNEPGRKPELLIEVMKQLDPVKFGFIIIGEGKLKPNFKPFKNVYDFGSVYDTNLKNELFQIADIYFQPGWVGLSIVEAMAYARPVFTLERTSEHLQCVEYSYIEHNYNGLIFNDLNQLIETVISISNCELQRLSKNAYDFASGNLRMEGMVKTAIDSINLILPK